MTEILASSTCGELARKRRSSTQVGLAPPLVLDRQPVDTWLDREKAQPA